MAFRKTYRKRRVFKRRSTRRVYKRLIRPETKTIYLIGTYPCDNNGTVNLINGISQGDTGDTREGRKITIKGLQLRGITQSTPSTGIDQFHRIMIVQQLRPNGVAPALTDILQTNQIQSLRCRFKLRDYKVLVDKTISLNAAGESGSNRFIRFNKKMILNEYFNSFNTGNITDVQSNALYLITLGSSPAGTTAGTFNYNMQLSFVDN